MTHSFKAILVPTDFSTASAPAMEYARMLGERFCAALHLLHVVEDPYLAAAWSEAYAAIPDMREQLTKESGRRLEELTALLPNLATTTEVVVGSPAKTIVNVARTRGVDLIVMGTHGRSGVAHLLLGSVAERVVRLAACPVLTVRERAIKAGDEEVVVSSDIEPVTI